MRIPNPGPGLWSHTHRGKRPGPLPSRCAQRLDCRGRSGRISRQPRVEQRGRHWAWQVRRLASRRKSWFLVPPLSRKTRRRAATSSQWGAPCGESVAISAGYRAANLCPPRPASGPFSLLKDFLLPVRGRREGSPSTGSREIVEKGGDTWEVLSGGGVPRALAFWSYGIPARLKKLRPCDQPKPREMGPAEHSDSAAWLRGLGSIPTASSSSQPPKLTLSSARKLMLDEDFQNTSELWCCWDEKSAFEEFPRGVSPLT